MPKFLVIRFSSIGDIVLTTPVIRCLKRQAKDAEIHFLTGKNFSQVTDNNPYIDKRIFYDGDLEAVIPELRENRYDYIIDLQNNLRSLRVKRALGVRSFTVDKLNIRKWVYVNFKMNVMPDLHIVDRYMKTVEPVGVVNDGGGLDYFLSPGDEKVFMELPENVRQKYIAFVIGAKHYTKQLPAEKIVSLLKKISLPVVLLGGKEDVEKGEAIMQHAGENVISLCGRCSLNESAAVIKNAYKVITHDTGLMHIAAAFGKDIISIWGNTVPSFGMTPYYGNSSGAVSKIVQVDGLNCRPCSKIGFEKCPRGHFKCMRLIDEEEIIKSIACCK